MLEQFLSGLVVRRLSQGTRGERPDWRHGSWRVLFLRADRIGDMILTTGILRAIAQAYPSLTLDVLASPLSAPVLAHEPYLNDTIVFDRRRVSGWPVSLAGLRSRGYDAVIDGAMESPALATVLLLHASRARHRIGIRAPGGDAAYTLPVPPRETAEHYVDKLGALVTAFGLQPTAVDLRPRIRLTAAEAERGERLWRGETDDRPAMGKRVLVNVSSVRDAGPWPDDRFVAVIRSVAAAAPRVDVLVISARADHQRAARIASASGARFVADNGIRDAMSIVAHADVVFTPEASIAHAASAFDKPAVVLHPAGCGRVWGPYRTDGRAVESLSGSVTGITAEEATRALLARLA